MESQQANLETPIKIQPDHQKTTALDPETPPRSLLETNALTSESPPRARGPLLESSQNHDSPTNNEPMKKIGAPDRLRVPLAFKNPERYRSPTDAMMSPVTKGLLARTRKASGSLIPPSFNQTKV